MNGWQSVDMNALQFFEGKSWNSPPTFLGEMVENYEMA